MSALESALEDQTPENSGDIEELWGGLKSAMYESAKESLGIRKRKTPDWFQDHDAEIEMLLADKNAALQRNLAENSARSKAAFLSAKADLQRKMRAMKDSWWNAKAEELQKLAERKDFQGLFSALKTVYGPRTNAIAPVKSSDGRTLTDMRDITGRWKEHFQNLLNQEGTANADAVAMLAMCPTQDELSSPSQFLSLRQH